jgi:hypothetical protein
MTRTWPETSSVGGGVHTACSSLHSDNEVQLRAFHKEWREKQNNGAQNSHVNYTTTRLHEPGDLVIFSSREISPINGDYGAGIYPVDD